VVLGFIYVALAPFQLYALYAVPLCLVGNPLSSGGGLLIAMNFVWKTATLAIFTLALASACGASDGASPKEEGASNTGTYSSEEREDLGRYFADAGVEGTFAMLDPQEKRIVIYNPERAREPFLPASTYKVPHALIALETGVVSGPEYTIEWDPSLHPKEEWWPEVWAQDHTLQTALNNSVIWYFQEVAKSIGEEREQEYVDRFNYGNRDISGGINRFWLTGGLRTSAEEQVEFLQRFYDGDLGVSEESTDAVKDMLVLEETPEYRLSGKSGWVGLGEDSMEQVGWQVGYLEKGNEVYFYALNLDIGKPEDADARLGITKGILRELELTTQLEESRR
jgi:beta-lactamase class D